MNRVNTPYDYGHDDSDLKFSQDESSIASSTALLPFVYSVKCPKAKERWLTMTIVVPPTIGGREFPKVTETNSSCFMLSLLSAQLSRSGKVKTVCRRPTKELSG